MPWFGPARTPRTRRPRNDPTLLVVVPWRAVRRSPGRRQGVVVVKGPASSSVPTDDAMTPQECIACGDGPIGVTEDALLILRGQWLPSHEFDTPIFVLDPDTRLQVFELPNGQLALLSDIERGPTVHAHKECFEQLIQEQLDEETDDLDEEEY